MGFRIWPRRGFLGGKRGSAPGDIGGVDRLRPGKCCVCGRTALMSLEANHYQSPVGNAWSASACLECIARRAASVRDVCAVLVRAFGNSTAEHMRLADHCPGVTVEVDGAYVPLGGWIAASSRPALKAFVRGNPKRARRPEVPGVRPVPGVPWLFRRTDADLLSPGSAREILDGEPGLCRIRLDHDFGGFPGRWGGPRLAYVGTAPADMTDGAALRAAHRLQDEARGDVHPRIFPVYYRDWPALTVEYARTGMMLFPDADPEAAWFDASDGDRAVALADDAVPDADVAAEALAHMRLRHPEASATLPSAAGAPPGE